MEFFEYIINHEDAIPEYSTTILTNQKCDKLIKELIAQYESNDELQDIYDIVDDYIMDELFERGVLVTPALTTNFYV